MILIGDVREKLKELSDQSVNCCVTSPPYWGLRDYGDDGQIGLEQTPDAFITELVAVFREVKRVLRDDGTLWLNIGDSYFSTTKGTGGMNPETSPKNAIKGKNNFQAFDPVRVNAGDLPIKAKDLVGIPWMLAFALRADGWYLRQDIIWHKPNPMPESVTDRCTKSHEYIFLLSKSRQYYFDNEAIKEPSSNLGKTEIRFGGNKYGDSDDPKHATKSGNKYTDTGKRNKRDVWTVTTKPFTGAHFATFPPALIEPCILAGCPEGGTVLDPFFGAGTTGLVAQRHNRKWIGCELNPEYAAIAQARIEAESNLFTA
jgi:DNA modification methylase